MYSVYEVISRNAVNFVDLILWNKKIITLFSKGALNESVVRTNKSFLDNRLIVNDFKLQY